MKDFLVFRKKKTSNRLTVYTLPKIIYAKYDGLILLPIAIINAINIVFLYDNWQGKIKLVENFNDFLLLMPMICIIIFADLNLIQLLMGKQFIEITDNFIRVKKLISDKKLDWTEVKGIEELRDKKVDSLQGVRLKSKKCKNFLRFEDITINFHMFCDINIDDFFEVLEWKKRG